MYIHAYLHVHEKCHFKTENVNCHIKLVLILEVVQCVLHDVWQCGYAALPCLIHLGPYLSQKLTDFVLTWIDAKLSIRTFRKPELDRSRPI